MVAITTQLSSNERFPFCVYDVAIRVHSFLQHVISKMTDERVNLLHDAKNSTTIRCFLLIGPFSVVRLYRLAASLTTAMVDSYVSVDRDHEA